MKIFKAKSEWDREQWTTTAAKQGDAIGAGKAMLSVQTPAAGAACSRRGSVLLRKLRSCQAAAAPWPPAHLLPRRCPGRIAAARASGCVSSDDGSQPASVERRKAGGGGGEAGLGAAGGVQLGAGLLQTIWGDRPQTDGPLNYAQMLEYLQNKRVLRLMIYDGGKNAIGANCPSCMCYF